MKNSPDLLMSANLRLATLGLLATAIPLAAADNCPIDPEATGTFSLVGIKQIKFTGGVKPNILQPKKGKFPILACFENYAQQANSLTMRLSPLATRTSPTNSFNSTNQYRYA